MWSCAAAQLLGRAWQPDLTKNTPRRAGLRTWRADATRADVKAGAFSAEEDAKLLAAARAFAHAAGLADDLAWVRGASNVKAELQRSRKAGLLKLARTHPWPHFALRCVVAQSALSSCGDLPNPALSPPRLLSAPPLARHSVLLRAWAVTGLALLCAGGDASARCAVLQITAALPQRTHSAAWSRLFRITHPGNGKGAWTAEEDAALQAAHRRHGAKWVKIGDALSRLPEACRDRWRALGGGAAAGRVAPRVTGAWSDAEEAVLREAVQAAQDAVRNLTSPQPAAMFRRQECAACFHLVKPVIINAHAVRRSSCAPVRSELLVGSEF